MALIIVSDTELIQTPWNFVGMMVKVLSFPSLPGSVAVRLVPRLCLGTKKIYSLAAFAQSPWPER
jgi:hypothetical protein